MKLNEMNIRDPFIAYNNGKYYLFGTRAEEYGEGVGGFDVYITEDLDEWSEPIECYDSEADGLNRCVNWAPEVWTYQDKFYMLATFNQRNGTRGTYALVSDEITGPYQKCSEDALTPKEWECLDGTLYIDKSGKPYLVFCHEHTQIIDGAICYVQLKEDFSGTIGTPKTIFAASEPYYIDEQEPGYHYVTDGPFLYRTKKDELVMLWSTLRGDTYLECMAYSDNGEIDGSFIHTEPLFRENGGHGMVFKAEDKLYLVLHCPNHPNGMERPVLTEIREAEDGKRFELV